MFYLKSCVVYSTIAVALGMQVTIPIATAAESGTIEEVIVTARQKSESLTQVPLSIQAFNGAQMVRTGVDGITDVLRLTSGVQYDSSGSTGTGNITIRGLAQPGLIGDETNVAIFIDGIYASGRDAAFLPFNGIERVEVVRGPQSALYGRNAFAGAVNYITKKPADQFDAEIGATLGSDSQGGGTFYLSTPVSDTVAVRIDGIYDESGGTHKDPDEGYRLGERINKAGRMRTIWNASDTLAVDIGYMYMESAEKPRAGFHLQHNSHFKLSVPSLLTFSNAPFPPSFVTPVAPGIYKLTVPADMLVTTQARGYSGEVKQGKILGGVKGAFGDRRDAEHASFTVEWAFDDYTLTALTGYNESQYRALTGYDQVVHVEFGPINFRGYDIGGQPNNNRREWSQELRLQSDNDGSLSYSAGLSYSDLSLDEWLWSASIGVTPADQAIIDANGLGLAANHGKPPFIDYSEHSTRSRSAFFSTAYAINDALTITLEGRNTWEEKTVDNLINKLGTVNRPTGFARGNWEYFTPRFTVDYLFNDNNLMYLNIGKGAKSGGINGTGIGDEQSYAPEENWTYELGAKLKFWQNKGLINIAAYYIDWDSQQIKNFATNSITPGVIPSVIVTNLGKTTVHGIDVDTRIQLNSNWSFNASYAYNESDIKRGRLSPEFGHIDFDKLGMNGTDYPVVTIPVLNLGAVPFPIVDGVVPAFQTDIQVSDGDLSGKRLPNTPKHKATFAVDYIKPFSIFNVYSSFNIVWTDKRYVDALNVAYMGSSIDANLTIGAESEQWRLALNIENVFNDNTPGTYYRPFLNNAKPDATGIARNARMWSIDIARKF